MSPPPPTARLEVVPPRVLRGRALLAISAYGLLLMVPVLLAAFAAVSLLRLGLLTWLIPLLTIAAATWLLPLGFGNPHIARLARFLPPAQTQNQPVLAQLTLIPRLRSGPRAWLDDADDIGWLSVSNTALEFRGDSVSLTLPLEQIRRVRQHSIGLRGLFLYQRLTLTISDLPQASELWVAERSSWLLPGSRRLTRELGSLLEHQTRAAKTQES